MTNLEGARPDNLNYTAEIEKLAKLETFDAAAFVAVEKSVQATCDFVLALALVFNDLKDLILTDSLLIQQAPSDQNKPSRELGAFTGGHMHLIRLFFALLYELVYVVEKNRRVLAYPLFAGSVNALPAKHRAAWDKIVAASKGGTSSDPDVQILLHARNKVAFHYDPKAIGRGYRASFPGVVSPVTFISRGGNISGTRFYFADRAAQAYLQEVFGDQDLHQYFLQQPTQLVDISGALYGIVTTFVTSRGFVWREPVV